MEIVCDTMSQESITIAVVRLEVNGPAGDAQVIPALTAAMVYAGVTLLVQVPRAQPRHWRGCCSRGMSWCDELDHWRTRCSCCSSW